MNTSAMIMMIVGIAGLWGGLAICLSIAMKKNKA